MNQNKFLQVFEGLVSNGIDVKRAMRTAERLSGGKSDPVVSSKSYTKGKLTTTATIVERVVAYGEKHNGHEWSLQQLAASLGVDPGTCSAAITKILASGTKLQRTGHGRYVFRKNG